MDIKQELSTLKSDIDENIEAYLDDVIKETKKTDVFVAGAIKYFKKTILAGGKRVRPIMMYWGYRAAGGKDYDAILKTAISIELIHAFLLMHDDIIDRDDLRHGKKTVQAKYREYNKKFLFNNEADHFGTSVAIIIGDLVYSLGNQIIFESEFDAELIVKALNKMQKIVGLTCVGEIQDVYMEYGKNITEENILKMYENKTAKYTFEGPLQLGAILAGSENSFFDDIERYAIPLGIAFQIRDDMLGVFGDIKKTGKPVGSDIVEGKMTLMVNEAFKRANEEQKEKMSSLLGNKDIDANGIQEFQRIIIETGAKHEMEEKIEMLIRQSEEELKEIKMESESKEFLAGLAKYLNNREK